MQAGLAAFECDDGRTLFWGDAGWGYVGEPIRAHEGSELVHTGRKRRLSDPATATALRESGHVLRLAAVAEHEPSRSYAALVADEQMEAFSGGPVELLLPDARSCHAEIACIRADGSGALLILAGQPIPDPGPSWWFSPAA